VEGIATLGKVFKDGGFVVARVIEKLAVEGDGFCIGLLGEKLFSVVKGGEKSFLSAHSLS